MNYLQTTKDFAEIRELIMNENYQKLIKHDSANTTGILVASWLGNEKALKALLDAGYSPNVTDENGRFLNYQKSHFSIKTEKLVFQNFSEALYI